MTDTPDLLAQISCLRREVIRRADRYPELIEKRRMLPKQARWEQRCMVAALRTLLDVAAERDQSPPTALAQPNGQA